LLGVAGRPLGRIGLKEPSELPARRSGGQLSPGCPVYRCDETKDPEVLLRGTLRGRYTRRDRTPGLAPATHRSGCSRGFADQLLFGLRAERTGLPTTVCTIWWVAAAVSRVAAMMLTMTAVIASPITPENNNDA